MWDNMMRNFLVLALVCLLSYKPFPSSLRLMTVSQGERSRKQRSLPTDLTERSAPMPSYSMSSNSAIVARAQRHHTLR
ncbi:hypothetical protein F5X96DRAFT_84606 [Biscogniauxia mediterranea]|nr:hypothetical protein F5X96DRAFT_84606 [Biscogniauxia mediterranea]